MELALKQATVLLGFTVKPDRRDCLGVDFAVLGSLGIFLDPVKKPQLTACLPSGFRLNQRKPFNLLLLLLCASLLFLSFLGSFRQAKPGKKRPGLDVVHELPWLVS